MGCLTPKLRMGKEWTRTTGIRKKGEEDTSEGKGFEHVIPGLKKVWFWKNGLLQKKPGGSGGKGALGKALEGIERHSGELQGGLPSGKLTN